MWHSPPNGSGNKGLFVKDTLIFVVANLALGITGCTPKGLPVEFANLCDARNFNEYVEVSAYFNESVTADRCGDESMSCSIYFVGEPAGTNALMAHIGMGGGKSAVEMTPGNGREIRDEMGAVVGKDQKVKILGRVVALNADYKERCYVRVTKIEKTGPRGY